MADAQDEEGEREDLEDLHKAVLGKNAVVSQYSALFKCPACVCTKSVAMAGGAEGTAVVTGKPHHLYVSIHKVEHLPKQWWGGPNPYVTCGFGGSLLKSSVARNTTSHTFNEVNKHTDRQTDTQKRGRT